MSSELLWANHCVTGSGSGPQCLDNQKEKRKRKTDENNHCECDRRAAAEFSRDSTDEESFMNSLIYRRLIH